MTRDQQLAAIRAACIRANPEIIERSYYLCATCQMKFSSLGMHNRACKGGATKHDKLRPIRLADVLLALGNKQYEVSLGGRLAVFFKPLTDKEIFAWRIHKDDLAQQIEECVAYLAQLLG